MKPVRTSPGDVIRTLKTEYRRKQTSKIQAMIGRCEAIERDCGASTSEKTKITIKFQKHTLVLLKGETASLSSERMSAKG